jgi:hypothetical protein
MHNITDVQVRLINIHDDSCVLVKPRPVEYISVSTINSSAVELSWFTSVPRKKDLLFRVDYWSEWSNVKMVSAYSTYKNPVARQR